MLHSGGGMNAPEWIVGLCTLFTTLSTALRQSFTNRRIDQVQDTATKVHAEVTTTNGQTLGQLAEKTVETVIDAAQKAEEARQKVEAAAESADAARRAALLAAQKAEEARQKVAAGHEAAPKLEAVPPKPDPGRAS